MGIKSWPKPKLQKLAVCACSAGALLGVVLIAFSIVIPAQLRAALDKSFTLPTDPDSDTYNEWKNPTRGVRQEVSIWSITNHVDVLTVPGTTAEVELVGPFVFESITRLHTITYNDDNTEVSYGTYKYTVLEDDDNAAWDQEIFVVDPVYQGLVSSFGAPENTIPFFTYYAVGVFAQFISLETYKSVQSLNYLLGVTNNSMNDGSSDTGLFAGTALADIFNGGSSGLTWKFEGGSGAITIHTPLTDFSDVEDLLDGTTPGNLYQLLGFSNVADADIATDLGITVASVTALKTFFSEAEAALMDVVVAPLLNISAEAPLSVTYAMQALAGVGPAATSTWSRISIGWKTIQPDVFVSAYFPAEPMPLSADFSAEAMSGFWAYFLDADNALVRVVEFGGLLVLAADPTNAGAIALADSLAAQGMPSSDRQLFMLHWYTAGSATMGNLMSNDAGPIIKSTPRKLLIDGQYRPYMMPFTNSAEVADNSAALYGSYETEDEYLATNPTITTSTLKTGVEDLTEARIVLVSSGASEITYATGETIAVGGRSMGRYLPHGEIGTDDLQTWMASPYSREVTLKYVEDTEVLGVTLQSYEVDGFMTAGNNFGDLTGITDLRSYAGLQMTYSFPHCKDASSDLSGYCDVTGLSPDSAEASEPIFQIHATTGAAVGLELIVQLNINPLDQTASGLFLGIDGSVHYPVTIVKTSITMTEDDASTLKTVDSVPTIAAGLGIGGGICLVVGIGVAAYAVMLAKAAATTVATPYKAGASMSTKGPPNRSQNGKLVAGIEP